MVETFGYDLLNGKTNLNNSGKSYKINAEVINFTNFSSHADQNEFLSWNEESNTKKIFITHDKKDQKENLKSNLAHNTNVEIIISRRSVKYQLSNK